ncbi:RebB family R body protein [Pseudoalteromonas luteoviolacea]|uniref:Glycerol-3-phosphate dehydrogenase subunit C n=1 Tax=Pseudoalteromonas luteoviolacea NCIMB 1942 TaxID=1365253 RepID=A0A162A0L0_9GAMM|nr:RebB family R body protein [Pseudoalteromonas luteoviolacea]KZN40865.1 hypothetical protein N482_20860 [Pseudoalteromonas luteoviolacea NCIMB 1942]KZX00390.1 glycerol-3-phosphate dehydrogenase [Pseudoalteromonas luteoviolacea]
MAFPTAVNSQITDSVSQVNTKVLGDALTVAVGNFMIATSQALSNATTEQLNNTFTTQAALVQSVNTLYCVDTQVTSKGITKVYR